MQSCSPATVGKCFLERSAVRPMAGVLLIGFVLTLGWVGWGHLKSVDQRVDELTAGSRPVLGLQVVKPDELVARMFSFPPGEAVFVSHVMENTPAHRAGIRRGDGIVSIEGRSIRSTADVSRILEQMKHGDLLRLTVIRGGLVHKLLVPLTDQPAG